MKRKSKLQKTLEHAAKMDTEATRLGADCLPAVLMQFLELVSESQLPAHVGNILKVWDMAVFTVAQKAIKPVLED